MGLIVTMCCCVHGRRHDGERLTGWVGANFLNTRDSKPLLIVDSPLEIATRLLMNKAFLYLKDREAVHKMPNTVSVQRR